MGKDNIWIIVVKQEDIVISSQFPFQSYAGNNYIFLLYDYDSNVILAHPIKNRKSENLIIGYEACCKILTNAGITPIYQRLNNEVSDDLIDKIKEKNLKYQLVTPHDHRTNPAERAIRTFKDHFTSILNGTDWV